MKKYLILALVIALTLALLFVAWKTYKFSVEKSEDFKRIARGGNKITDGSKVSDISESRKKELKELAKDIYKSIWNIDWGLFMGVDSRETYLKKAMNLNDAEFGFLNDYYYKDVSENTLYYDVDYEIMPNTQIDDDILLRIKELNLKYVNE